MSTRSEPTIDALVNFIPQSFELTSTPKNQYTDGVSNQQLDDDFGTHEEFKVVRIIPKNMSKTVMMIRSLVL